MSHVATVAAAAALAPWCGDAVLLGAAPSNKALDVQAPVLYVQEELVGAGQDRFGALSALPRLGRAAETDFSMKSLYGERVCTGEGWFVEEGRAPKRFCRHRNGDDNVAKSIEGKWHKDYDEYALEKVMLGKWLESPLRCQDAGREGWCRTHADVVVVPSPFVSATVQNGWLWASVWNLTTSDFEHFWDRVREDHYRPDEGHTPLIVMHCSYSFGVDRRPGQEEENDKKLLLTLSQQPKGFIEKVVIGAIESNVPITTRGLFSSDWSQSPLAEMRRRAQLRAADVANGGTGGPLFVTLPYPTGVQSARFTQSDGQYDARHERKVTVSFVANCSKSPDRNWIRTIVHDRIEAAGGEGKNLFGNSSVICAPDFEAMPHCDLIGMNVWHLAADSEFCLEPPGDTPTRSHFYLAVLSGCVPVLFDGGHVGYDESEPTWWAWRRPPPDGKSSLLPLELEELFFDYKDFSVVYNSSDIRSGAADYLSDIRSMRSKDPARFQGLRRARDGVSSTLTFSQEPPRSWLPGSGEPVPTDMDAFEVFQAVVLWEASQEAPLVRHS